MRLENLRKMGLEALNSSLEDNIREDVQNVVCACSVDTLLCREEGKRAVQKLEAAVDAVQFRLRRETPVDALQLANGHVPQRLAHLVDFDVESLWFQPLEGVKPGAHVLFLLRRGLVLREDLLVKSEHDEVNDLSHVVVNIV